MKPASELFAEFPHETWWGGHLPEKCRRCRLEAWLREADSEKMPDWFENTLKDLFPNAEAWPTKVNAHWLKVGLSRLWRKVRRDLLGTTRSEGKK